MKKKLTILMFSLLIAVGWTSSVFAQSAVFTVDSAKTWTYDWVEGSTTHYGVDPTEKVTNPTQMYYFLRHIYMDKRFPGPHYSAYRSDATTRERKVYYGGVAGGWDIPSASDERTVFFTAGTNTGYGTSVTATKNGVTVTVNNSHSTGNNGFNNTPYRLYQGPLTISVPSGYKITKILFLGNRTSTSYAVSGISGTGYSYNGNNGTWLGSAQSVSLTVNSQTRLDNFIVTVSSSNTGDPEELYKPSKEGYTLVVIKLKNTLSLIPEDGTYDDTYFNTKQEIIDYFTDNVESMQLMTDGLRIGEGLDVGTVFNFPIDEYNRFFVIGKGQARQKAYPVLAMQNTQPSSHPLLGEDVPFKEMFEEFSPSVTTVGQGIDDFYSEMMQGNVYHVIHDCASVIQIEHEFAMSGKTGTTAYKMTGMNIFIPDYRLLYFDSTYVVNSSVGSQRVDGRDITPYENANATNKTNATFRACQYFTDWFAQYHNDHQPLVGIYLLDLEAEANKVADYSEDNRYYQSTLDWTSSLNEMSGNGVQQTYIIYQVVTDSVTGDLINVPIDTIENCSDFRPQVTLDTLYEQHAHSYSITYVIMGYPTDSDHPGFIAWSNTATVIIPGYDDFMVLGLHHYESDFDVNYTVAQGKNYYRNYLYPENDFANGITREAIKNGYDSFILYRTSTEGKVPVAKLKLAVDSQNRVLYKITYFDENEDYTGPNNINIQQIINNLINN